MGVLVFAGIAIVFLILIFIGISSGGEDGLSDDDIDLANKIIYGKAIYDIWFDKKYPTPPPKTHSDYSDYDGYIPNYIDEDGELMDNI